MEPTPATVPNATTVAIDITDVSSVEINLAKVDPMAHYINVCNPRHLQEQRGSGNGSKSVLEAAFQKTKPL